LHELKKEGMKKVIYLFVVSIALCTSASAQSELTYKNGVLQNGTKLNATQVKEVISGNSEALQKYNRGRSLYIAGQVIVYPSAFLLGWNLGTQLVRREVNVVFLGVGMAGTVVGLIMALSGERQISTSLQLYNSKANNTSVSCQINFGFTQTGVGLSMKL